MSNLKVVPPGLKPLQPYIKIAEEHEKRDPTITYWCRLYSIQSALKINDKAPESSAFLLQLMTWLETVKKSNSSDESITNDVVAQAHIENYALKLFLWADGEDRAGRFNKNVVKSFYTAGFLYDLVDTFGEPSEEVLHQRKYAKWKSTYIHNCLKNGITPISGPVAMEGEDEEEPSSPYPASNFNPPPAPQDQTPYPVGGLFNIPYKPDSSNLPIPGSYAPPSTPNGTNRVPPTAAVTEEEEEEERDPSALGPEVYQKAQKYCKWAGSALQYEDAATAIENLQKALRLLTTGQDA